MGASVRCLAYVRAVVAVHDVREARERPFEARRVWMPSSGVESWTVVGPDLRPVRVVDEFLAWLTQIERSPNTVEAYARDLKLFWSFLASRELAWGTGDGFGVG